MAIFKTVYNMFEWEVSNAAEVDARMHAGPESRAPQRKMKAAQNIK